MVALAVTFGSPVSGPIAGTFNTIGVYLSAPVVYSVDVNTAIGLSLWRVRAFPARQGTASLRRFQIKNECEKKQEQKAASFR